MRPRITDLRGISRMAIDAATATVYKSIRYATRAVGAGFDRALSALEPELRKLDSSPLREAVVAAVNGVLGDHLAESGNSLAVDMQLRRGGMPLLLTREGIGAAVAAPSSKILVLVHGLCMNDLRWRRNGHDHGAALERDLGFTALYLRYNIGLHVSMNGRELARLLDDLSAAWPVPISDIVIIAHSMGGTRRPQRLSLCVRAAPRLARQAARHCFSRNAARRRSAREGRALAEPSLGQDAVHRAVCASRQGAKRRHHGPAARLCARRGLAGTRSIRRGYRLAPAARSAGRRRMLCDRSHPGTRRGADARAMDRRRPRSRAQRTGSTSRSPAQPRVSA